jgi:crotonobetainyl-CoA:carnitine CoA-transferase CaiB-like acyl-CoA transferase
VEDPQFGPVLHAGIVPHLPDDPGAIRWCGPPVGAHTVEVMGELLDLQAAEVEELRRDGVI